MWPPNKQPPTVNNNTPSQWPPLLSSRGHLSVVPMSVPLLFLPLFSHQQECHIIIIIISFCFQQALTEQRVVEKMTTDKIIQTQVYCRLQRRASIIPFDDIEEM